MRQAFDDFTEPAVDRRKVLLGLLFGGAAGLAAWRQPRSAIDYLGRDKLENVVPKKIGNWNFVAASGLVVPPEDQLADAVYSQLLTRVYSDGENPSMMLLIAQSGSQTGLLQIHRPETCYTAGGYQISPVTHRPIRLGSKVLRANAMEASAGGPTEHILYWTRVGNRLPQSWREQKVAVAEQNLRGMIPDAILVRVSTINPDAAAAKAALEGFVRAFLASVPTAKRAVFIV